MVQILLHMDIVEDSIVKRYCQRWGISKHDTIKKIIREVRKYEKEIDKEADENFKEETKGGKEK